MNVKTSRNLLVCAMLGSLSIGVHGQVIKCLDPKTGRVTYTDGLCTSAETSSVVARRQTLEEAGLERRQAEIAQQRVRQETADLQARHRPAAAPPLGHPSLGPAPAIDKTGTVECERARWKLELEQGSATKEPSLAAALVGVEAACGIDASKYLAAVRHRGQGSDGRACTGTGTQRVCR